MKQACLQKGKKRDKRAGGTNHLGRIVWQKYNSGAKKVKRELLERTSEGPYSSRASQKASEGGVSVGVGARVGGWVR